MTDLEDRRRALAFNAVGPALNEHDEWVPLSVRKAVADAVLEAIAGEPAEHCGAIFPAFEGAPPTECVLRPGHHGSHANEYDTRWVEKADDQPAAALDRILADAAHHDECANLSKIDEGVISHSSIAAGLRIAAAYVRHDDDTSRESERQLQQRIDRQAKEIDRLRDELAVLHVGEEEPTSLRHPAPTPAEWLWLWNRATPAQRLEQAGQIIDAGLMAGTCFQMAHEKTIQRLRAEQAAVARVRAELDAIQEHGKAMNPYDRDPVAELDRVRAALDPTA